jgi:hypothetical protein
MSVDPLYRPIEAELYRLVSTCDSFEQVRWLVAVDDCFDGGDFEGSEWNNLRYRLAVLREMGVETVRLATLCEVCVNGERSLARNERREPWPSLRATAGFIAYLDNLPPT